MAVSPRSAAVFVVDCSYTMSLARTFTQGQGRDRRETTTTPIDVAKQYVKAKVVQRMIRELKTTPVTIILYGCPKTKNILTARSKEAGNYDRHEDPYRYMYELVAADWQPGMATLAQVDKIVAGEGPDAEQGSDWSADAHSALILAMETIESIPKTAKFTRDIYLLTDGESATDWDRWQDTVERMNSRRMALTVVGFHFDDEDYDFVEQDKTTIKRSNEEHFRKIVDKLEEPSICATLGRALDSIALPVIKETRSVKTGMLLTLGDNERFADRSLSIHVDISKAVSPAPIKSMGKLSLQSFPSLSSGYNKRPRDNEDDMDENVGEVGPTPSTSKKVETGAQSQTQGGDAKPSNLKYTLGHLGRSLEKMLELERLAPDGDDNAHTITIEKRYRYKPIYDPDADKDDKKDGSKSAAAKGKGKANDREAEKERIKSYPLAPEDHLDLGYYYGGDIVAAEDLEDGAGTLSGLVQGMMITGFMKQSEARLDWRIGDALFVTASVGQTGSEHLFSALINAMTERKACAIARYVGRPSTDSKTGRVKFPDPRLGLLWPAVQETDAGVVEFCYWIRMPYAEDMRQIVFPSLDTIYGQSGVILKEHANLPTKAHQDAMDDFVDAMDVSQAGPEDDDGKPTHWFSIKDSYSPAIHNINNALVFRLSNPDGELPPVSQHLTKYLDPPESVVQQARQAIERAVKTLDVKAAPAKPTQTYRGKKGASNDTADVNYDPTAQLLTGQASTADVATSPSRKPPVASTSGSRIHENERKMLPGAPGPAVRRVATQVKARASQASAVHEDEEMAFVESHAVKEEPASSNPHATQNDVHMADEDEPDTEDEEVEEASSTLTSNKVQSLSTGNLESDFDTFAAQHGVNRAMTALRVKVVELVNESFSTQHYEKCVKALKRARERAVRDGAADAYNEVIKQIESTFETNPNKRDFVDWIEKHSVGEFA
ncbi:hypothetical protein ACM66B_001657 [Microbotryomycetes sp. NB124-2]